MLALSGAFAVREESGNKFLEVPGEPIDGFGLLFGPDGVVGEVSARIFATSHGRRFPEFGIGSGDAVGHKLWVLPGQNLLELRRGDDTRAQIKFDAKSGTWIYLHLRVTSENGKWKVEGKAWTSGEKEPAAWMISFQDSEPPAKGRASVWGSPYSGTPIRFDDLAALPLAEKR
jgi:hypothetical protein